jgi:hypothetical protein
VPIFARNKGMGVQSFVIKLLNNNCSELDALVEGPRLDRRINLTVVVLVVPEVDGEMRFDEAFTAVTKEFSANGVGVILSEARPLEDVVLGFRWLGEMRFARAHLKHFQPMGGGFYRAGFQLTEMLHAADHPQLQKMFV